MPGRSIAASTSAPPSRAQCCAPRSRTRGSISSSRGSVSAPADSRARRRDGSRRREPRGVGGTGFYIRALADGLFQEPPLDPARRDRLRDWTAALSGPDLSRWALRLDPRFSGGGRQRAARALEVALLTGRPLSLWQRMARAAGVMRPWYI